MFTPTPHSLTPSLTHALTHALLLRSVAVPSLPFLARSPCTRRLSPLHGCVLLAEEEGIACVLYTLSGYFCLVTPSLSPLPSPLQSTASPISSIVVVPAHVHAHADGDAMDGTGICLPRPQCPICLDVVDEAFLTKCGHTFW